MTYVFLRCGYVVQGWALQRRALQRNIFLDLVLGRESSVNGRRKQICSLLPTYGSL